MRKQKLKIIKLMFKIQKINFNNNKILMNFKIESMKPNNKEINYKINYNKNQRQRKYYSMKLPN